MSTVHVVDVRYRGIEAGAGLSLSDFGQNSAYLAHPSPMPVGAQLELATEAGSLVAEVIRVHEQATDGAPAPGHWVRAIDLEGAARTWWDAQVSCDDPEIPTPQVEVTAPPPRAKPRVVASPPVETPEQPGTAADAPPDEDAGRGGKSSRKQKRDTVVMSTVEIKDVIEGAGQSLETAVFADSTDDTDGDDSDDESGADQPLAAARVPAEQDAEAKGKKRPKRRRRKSRG